VSFKYFGPASVKGIVRVYLLSAYPRVQLYVSPIHIDPRDPVIPLSSPAGYAAEMEERFGLSADIDLFRWFKLAYGKATVEREVHTFIFNNKGYVQAYGNKNLEENAGKGLSFQFIVKAEQVVDTKYLEKPYPQQTWGFSLLQPLSVGMNREQSLDSGDNGLEQRGTPTDIGQRALEFQSVR